MYMYIYIQAFIYMPNDAFQLMSFTNFQMSFYIWVISA